MAAHNKPLAIMAADVKTLTSVLRKPSVITQTPCIGCRHDCKRQNVGGHAGEEQTK